MLPEKSGQGFQNVRGVIHDKEANGVGVASVWLGHDAVTLSWCRATSARTSQPQAERRRERVESRGVLSMVLVGWRDFRKASAHRRRAARGPAFLSLDAEANETKRTASGTIVSGVGDPGRLNLHETLDFCAWKFAGTKPAKACR